MWPQACCRPAIIALKRMLFVRANPVATRYLCRCRQAAFPKPFGRTLFQQFISALPRLNIGLLEWGIKIRQLIRLHL